MDITKAFIKAKQPCADGFRWYLRNAREDSTYQQLLDELVKAGRVQDAVWLITQFGPTDAVLTLDSLDVEDIVFAGTIQVRQGIDVGGVLHAGRDIRAGGGIRAGTSIHAGGDVICEGAVFCGGELKVQGRLQAAWSVHARGVLECEELRTGWDLRCEAAALVRGQAQVGQQVEAEAQLQCIKGLRAGGAITCAGDLQTGHGIEAGGDLQVGGHIHAGWGIRACGDLVAEGTIRAGESICAEGEIRAGEGYGVFAGLDVRTHAWESSARVHARHQPPTLRSGWWAGPLPGISAI